MRDADIFSVNNEFCYSTRGEALKGKDYTFRANPTDCALLKNIGVDFVNLANNHTYDYGEEALLDTLDTLSVYGIPYVGAGRNLDEATRPLYYVLNGRKIAFVSATQIERSANYTKEATESSAGVLKTLKPDRYVSVIQEASKNADIVIAIVHWGTEGNDRFGADQKELAKAFVDAGADCIIGCHSHCLQGVEFIDNVPVFYSLGNYWFAVDDKMPESFKTGIAKIEIGEDGSVIPYFLPCEFNMGVTKLITEQSERAKDYAYLESLSTSARVDSNGRIFAK
jgi:poly-gamma-glutamate synthesis protein (capsule biosynthesis protein)